MSFSHTLTESWAQGSNGLSKSKTVTAGAEANLSESIPGASTDRLLAYALDVSQAKSVYILAGRDMTVETNDGTTPAKTLTLKANEPVVWHSDSPHANPFGTTDVTALYVTLAAGDAADLEIRVLVDPTV